MYDANQLIQDTAILLERYLRRTIQSSFKDGENVIKKLPLENLNGQRSALNDATQLLVRIANGEVPGDLADDIIMGDVEDAVRLVCRVLFAAPGNPQHYEIPPAFWNTEIGEVIRHCQLWLRGDDLITYSEAAQMLFPDLELQSARMRIKRMVARGELTHYADPRENNPQRAARVSRQEIEQSHDDSAGES